MEGLREWFTGELQRLGFTGLEGVFDYLATMSDGQVDEYLQSLLGTGPEIRAFIKSYLSNRAVGDFTAGSADRSGSASSDASQSTWDAVGRYDNTFSSKKTKRGRGKKRTASARESSVKRNGKASFASAATNQKSPAPNSSQADAIRNAPAEQVRQKVREYRKSKRAINCVRCGNIEDIIPEDGACSFCQAPIFSMWDRDEGSSTAIPTQSMSSKVRHSDSKRYRRPMPVVLGRYVIPSGSERGGVFDSCLFTDIAGRNVLCPSNGAQGGGDTKASLEGSSESYYSNPSVPGEYLEDCCASAAESLKQSLTLTRVEEPDGPFPSDVYGRVQLDHISPSVCIYTD